jgi:hypothetical protein
MRLNETLSLLLRNKPVRVHDVSSNSQWRAFRLLTIEARPIFHDNEVYLRSADNETKLEDDTKIA